jgi:MurNAc alpha-1-phosphate uridylyltransferase
LLRAELFAPPWCDIPPGNPRAWQSPAGALAAPRHGPGAVVSASLYTGRWTDVGTPERLAELNR